MAIRQTYHFTIFHWWQGAKLTADFSIWVQSQAWRSANHAKDFATQHSSKSNQLCGKHHFTTHLNFQNTLEKCFIGLGFIAFTIYLPVTAPQSHLGERDPQLWDLVASCRDPPRNRCRWTMGSLALAWWPKVHKVHKKSLENPRMWRKKIWKMVKMPAKCGWKGHWHGGKSTLRTLQILPTLVTKNCYLQRQLVTNLPL